MINVIKEGTAPTFEFYCPVCGEEFNVTGYEGDVKILQHPLPHREAKTFYFSAETQCQCCGYLVRSKRIAREIDFEKEKEFI